MICQHEIDALIVPYLEQECKPIDEGTQEANLRKEPRWEVFDQSANLHHGGMECCVRIRDMSVSGMRIADVPDEVGVGESVQVVTTLGHHGTLAVTCQVMHVFEMSAVRYAGLKFTPPRAEELEPLAAYLGQMDPTGADLKIPLESQRR